MSEAIAVGVRTEIFEPVERLERLSEAAKDFASVVKDVAGDFDDFADDGPRPNADNVRKMLTPERITELIGLVGTFKKEFDEALRLYLHDSGKRKVWPKELQDQAQKRLDELRVAQELNKQLQAQVDALKAQESQKPRNEPERAPGQSPKPFSIDIGADGELVLFPPLEKIIPGTPISFEVGLRP